jgi:sialate O-acetylesterase
MPAARLFRRPLALLAALAAAPTSALLGAIAPASLFRDGAILQRDKPVPIWGTADAGERIRVTFADQTRSTTADTEGRWSVTLDPLPASSTPATLTITGHDTVTLTDVLVGEVWLASGQSNMEWPLRETYDHALDTPSSANRLLRHIEVRKVIADSPATTATFERAGWQVAAPGTTGDFSAVAYYFARELQARLGVPVGIVNSTWGGTRAESWLDPVTLATDPALAPVRDEWVAQLASYPERKAKHEADHAAWEQRQAEAKTAGRPFTERPPGEPWGPGHHSTPASLYNGMIAPLAPYALRGVIWYQGESNAWRPERYQPLFASLITGWRARFGQGDIPFYWAQLASFAAGDPDGVKWALLREAQTQTLALPATGQALTLDLGDVPDIHPREKLAVGRRLARLALARTHGFELPDSGPALARAEREPGAFRIHFSDTHGGLRTPLRALTGFEVAGADRIFRPATAKIEGDTVLASSSAVPEPVAVRYAWRNAPDAALFNREGLPAVPFRTDTW